LTRKRIELQSGTITVSSGGMVEVESADCVLTRLVENYCGFISKKIYLDSRPTVSQDIAGRETFARRTLLVYILNVT
jgi:hypothetical protein